MLSSSDCGWEVNQWWQCHVECDLYYSYNKNHTNSMDHLRSAFNYRCSNDGHQKKRYVLLNFQFIYTHIHRCSFIIILLPIYCDNCNVFDFEDLKKVISLFSFVTWFFLKLLAAILLFVCVRIVEEEIRTPTAVRNCDYFNSILQSNLI